MDCVVYCRRYTTTRVLVPPHCVCVCHAVLLSRVRARVCLQTYNNLSPEGARCGLNTSYEFLSSLLHDHAGYFGMAFGKWHQVGRFVVGCGVVLLFAHESLIGGAQTDKQTKQPAYERVVLLQHDMARTVLTTNAVTDPPQCTQHSRNLCYVRFTALPITPRSCFRVRVSRLASTRRRREDLTGSLGSTPGVKRTSPTSRPTTFWATCRNGGLLLTTTHYPTRPGARRCGICTTTRPSTVRHRRSLRTVPTEHTPQRSPVRHSKCLFVRSRC